MQDPQVITWAAARMHERPAVDYAGGRAFARFLKVQDLDKLDFIFRVSALFSSPNQKRRYCKY